MGDYVALDEIIAMIETDKVKVLLSKYSKLELAQKKGQPRQNSIKDMFGTIRIAIFWHGRKA